MKLGYPLPSRQEILGKLKGVDPVGHEPVEFQGVRNSWPVHIISIDLPRYRLKNGRTLAAQEDLLARNPGLPRNLFQDPESDLAQSEQHKLLLELSHQGPLWQEMSKGAQKEPIVLNKDGLVINGNRRLCAMRELHEKSGQRYDGYRNVRVVVFPDVDDRQIYEFEVREQIKPDVKDKYDWIQEAKMLQRGMKELRLTESQLAEIYEFPPQKIKERLQLLAAADEYLADRGKPGQYNLVVDDEFSLKKILQGRKKLKSEGDRDSFTSLSYLLMETPVDDLKVGRLYDAIPDIQENLQSIIGAIKAEVGITEAPDPKSAEVDELLGGPSSSVAGTIARAAINPTKKQAILDVVTNEIQEARTRERKKESVDYPLRRVQAASAYLLDARNALRSESRTDGMKPHLDSIEASVAEIRAQLKKRA